MQSSREHHDTGLSEIQMQEASIADRCPLEQTWDEADEDALVARIRGISARASMDTASEIELRRQDEALLRESEAVVARALHIPGERKMLMKLDDQLEKFMGNNELQHIKCVGCVRKIKIITCKCHDPPSTQTHHVCKRRINGVSEKQMSLIKAVGILFHMRMVQAGASITIQKTEHSVVPMSRFGEPRIAAGRM